MPDSTQQSPLVFRESDHTYWLGEPDVGTLLFSSTQIGSLSGLVDTTWFQPKYAERGTFVHQATEYYDRPDVDLDESDLDPGIVPYLEGYKKFVADCKPKWQGIEVALSDPALRIAGTIDRWGTIKPPKSKTRVKVVLDIKSGSTAPYHAIQLACYAHLVSRHLQLSGAAKQHTSKPLVDRYAVYITKRGTYSLKKFSDVADIAVFMAARTLVLWKEEHKLLKR
jgi:hypothetical protein